VDFKVIQTRENKKDLKNVNTPSLSYELFCRNDKMRQLQLPLLTKRT